MTSTACASASRDRRRERVMTANNERARDLAHIHHAELLTPTPDESLRFFVEMFGMQNGIACAVPVGGAAMEFAAPRRQQ